MAVHLRISPSATLIYTSVAACSMYENTYVKKKIKIERMKNEEKKKEQKKTNPTVSPTTVVNSQSLRPFEYVLRNN